MFFKKKCTVVTHDGSFHADDVFAVATISLLHRGAISIRRSRNKEDWKKADVLVDVGGEYSPEEGRFDHHQENAPAPRSSGSPYAAFGLVWKHYGEALCGSPVIARRIEEKLVESIDIIDNGAYDTPPFSNGVYPYTIQDCIGTFSATWKETDSRSDEGFMKAVTFATHILMREIIKNKDSLEAQEEVRRIYTSSPDKRVIVFDRYLPWKEALIDFPEPLYVVMPREDMVTWGVHAVARERKTFELRKPFPLAWAGKTGNDFVSVSGVAGALFCHTKRFIAVASSKEDAVLLTKKSIGA